MPLFKDINYEIQDQAMFDAVKACREYKEHYGIKYLMSKIWYEGNKHKVPYKKWTNEGVTLAHHMDIIIKLEQALMNKGLKEVAFEAKTQETIVKQSIGVSIYADTIEEIDAIENGLNADVIVCTSKLFNRIFPYDTPILGTRLDYRRVKFIDDRPVDVQAQDAIKKFMALTDEQKIEYIKSCKP